MQDLIPKGTGNSRFMKSAIASDTTWEQFREMLRNGTFPFDLNGVNSSGIAQMGTILNKANLFSGETEAKYPDGVETPDSAFGTLTKAALFKEGSTSVGLNQWYKAEDPRSSKLTLNQFAYNGTVLAVSGSGGGSPMLSYDKGRTWTPDVGDLNRNLLYSMCAKGDGGIWAWVMDTSGTYYITTDGKSWTKHTLTNASGFAPMWSFFFGDTLCAISKDGNSFYSETHGVVSLPITAGILYPSYCIVGSTIYISEQAGPTIIKSTDGGRTWSTASTLPSGVKAYSIGYKNGTFVVSNGGSGLRSAYSSTDLVTWTPSTVGWSAAQPVIVGNEYFILPYHKIYSVDGLTWNIYSPNVYPSGQQYGAFIDGTIVISARISPDGIYTAKEELVNAPTLTDIKGNPLTLANAKVTYGSYIGNGLYGVDNPTQIQLEEDPVFICVIASSGFGAGWHGPSNMIIWQPGVYRQSMEYDGSRSSVARMSYNPESKIFSYYSGDVSGYNSAGVQLNYAGSTYCYVAISIG